MEELIHFFTKGGVVSAVMAVVIVLLTAVIKQPIKLLAQKRVLPAKVTRFIPMIPIAMGAALTALVLWIKNGSVQFGDEYFELWMCSSGLSIALYSCYANFRDSGKLEFPDMLKQGIYECLGKKLNTKNRAKLKELTDSIANCFHLSQVDPVKNDFYATMQEILKEYLGREEISEFSKEVEGLWTGKYGRKDCLEEVETVACTATEKYEYEIRKRRSASQMRTEEQSGMKETPETEGDLDETETEKDGT